MLYIIINKIANVQNRDMLLPTNTILDANMDINVNFITKNTNEYKYSFFT